MPQFNFKCPITKHNQQKIMFICLQSKCKQLRKCCVLCVQQNHQRHEVISIQKFLQQININLQKNNKNPQKQQIYTLLNKMRNQYSVLFTSMKNSFNHAITRCQNKINDYLNNVHQILAVSYQNTIAQHVYNTFVETNLTINQYLVLSEKAKLINIGTLKETSIMMMKFLNDFSDKIYEKQDKMLVQFKTIEDSLKNIKMVGKKYEEDFYLSERNRALSLQLSDSKKTLVKTIGNNGYPICCLDKPMDPLNNRFFVKIGSNPTKKLFIGVCLLDIVKASNYINCCGFGRGTWALDQNPGSNYSNPQGYATFSHHTIQNFNSTSYSSTVNAGWNLKQGDILEVKISFTEKIISFNIINQHPDLQSGQVTLQEMMLENCFDMDIETNLGELYPFIGYSCIGSNQATILSREEVQILMKPYESVMNQENDTDDQGEWSNDELF